MRLRHWRSLAALITVAWATGAAADEFADLEQLRARVAALERQNADLRATAVPRLPAVSSDDLRGAYSNSNFGDATGDEARIRGVVDQYLSERNPQWISTEAGQAAPASEGHVVGSDLGMSASWNNGLELSTKNKDFRVHVGGRTQFDVGWFSVDSNVQNNINIPYGDGADFRRARLRIDGTMYEVIDWVVEYDLMAGTRVRNAAGTGTTDIVSPAPTDLWWTFKELPVVGNIRVGNQKEPIGFEHLVSSRFQPFIERSFNQDTFYGGAYNGFTPGVQAFDNYADEMGLWQIGIFKPTNNVFAYNTGDGDYAITGRLTKLLWYVDEGRGLLHVGASGRQATAVSTAGVPGRQITFRTRDALRTGISSVWPVPASTGTVFGDDMQWGNVELAAVYGPWTLQGEYLVSSLQDARTTLAGASVGEVVYHGGYIELLYYLTGESENYNKKTGAFDRVKPHENFFLVRDEAGCRCFGSGAWQVGARYNYLDLNDEGIDGGILHNFTGGVSWFLNPNMKIQFDYIATHRDAALAGTLGDGWIHGWGMRFAHDF